MRKIPKKAPAIVVTFHEPRYGYWDGGKKQGGTFTPTLTTEKNIIQWGCWELNYWFRLKFGRSWKQAASIALRKIKRDVRVPATIELVWE